MYSDSHIVEQNWQRIPYLIVNFLLEITTVMGLYQVKCVFLKQLMHTFIVEYEENA